jgi:aryl-alcohol dehydrogenase-like predicted oxidoreductase
VTNLRGRLSDADIEDIVRVAKQCSISIVDTARGYGDAEDRLRPYARDFSVISKIRGGGDVVPQIEDSLRRLDVGWLASVLVHDWEDLDASARWAAASGLSVALDAGLVERVGVSIYTELGVDSAVSTFESVGVPLRALQVPANALDRRLDDSVLLTQLANDGAEIVVRSAFLQGLLVSEVGGQSTHPDVASFFEWVRDDDEEASLLEACLAHVRSLPWATHVVVGVTSGEELAEICRVWEVCGEERVPIEFGSSDLELIDPRRW